MILSPTLPDASLAADKQSAASSRQSQSDARAAFDGILVNLASTKAKDASAKANAASASTKADTDAASAKGDASGDGKQQVSTTAPFGSAAFKAAPSSVGIGTAVPIPTSDVIPTGQSGTGAAPTQPAAVISTAASLDSFLATLPASLTVQSDTNAKSASGLLSTSSNRRRTDGKSDASAPVATQDPANATSPQPVSILSGLLGANTTTPTKTSVDPSSAPSVGTSANATQTAALAAAKGQAVSATGEQVASDASAVSAGVSASASQKNSDAAVVTSVVKSVSVETQLAPAPTLSPMQQIIDTVQKLATGDGSTATTSVIATPVTPSVSSRTMTLVLEPDNLGTVTVRMQLRGNSLDLQLDVANAQTLGLLTKDKDSLTAAMSGQDYQVGTLTMRASDTQSASQGNNNGSQNQTPQGDAANSSSSQNGSSSRNGNGGPDSSSGNTRGDSGARQNASTGTGEQGARRDPRAPDTGGVSGVYV